MSDIEMYMYSYYLSRGVDLEKLINLNSMEKHFYIASMQVNRKEEVDKINAMLGGG